MLAAPPSPIFISTIATPHSPKGGAHSHTPPRSPSGEKYLGKTLSPKTGGSLFDLGSSKQLQQLTQGSSSGFEDKFDEEKKTSAFQDSASTKQRQPFNQAFAKTESSAL